MNIGILGGAFDPIHNGHIRLALAVQQEIGLALVRLIPVNIPPHRPPAYATAEQRCTMIALAIKDQPKLLLDTRELENIEISYTINTLKSLRQEFKQDILFLIVGEDAFSGIDTWKNWQKLLHYAHIIVAQRPKANAINPKLSTWLKQHKTNDLDTLHKKPDGCIYFIHNPLWHISSTAIRLAYQQSQTNDLLPTKIHSYIQEQRLYTKTA